MVAECRYKPNCRVVSVELLPTPVSSPEATRGRRREGMPPSHFYHVDRLWFTRSRHTKVPLHTLERSTVKLHFMNNTSAAQRRRHKARIQVPHVTGKIPLRIPLLKSRRPVVQGSEVIDFLKGLVHPKTAQCGWRLWGQVQIHLLDWNFTRWPCVGKRFLHTVVGFHQVYQGSAVQCDLGQRP